MPLPSDLEGCSLQQVIHSLYPDIPWREPRPKMCPGCKTELTDATRLPRRKSGQLGDCRVCHKRGLKTR